MWISGAGSGIGAATAELFSKLGASLALTDRDCENLTAVGKACEESSAKKVCIQYKLLLIIFFISEAVKGNVRKYFLSLSGTSSSGNVLSLSSQLCG